jgi:homoserine kinase
MARPAFRGGSAHIRVPATSANLGPGFDALGLALDLHDDVLAVIGEDGIVVDVAGEGADQVARNEKNLVVSAMRATFDALGGQPRGIELSCANRIPHGRGLGSSAAAIVAGVLLARSLVLGGEQALPMPAVLDLASGLEGHADNVAACILGGLTIAWVDSSDASEALDAADAPDSEPAATGQANVASFAKAAMIGPVHAVRVALDPLLRPFVFVPPTVSSTKAARKNLPANVLHADAAHNLGRAALLIAALSGTARTASGEPADEDDVGAATVPADVLLAATDDRLHQQYRRTGMTATANLLNKLRGSGIAAVMSGAGPSVLAFTRTSAEVDAANAALPKGWWGSPLAVDLVGAHLVSTQR